MLTLQREWQSFTGGEVAKDLLAQFATKQLRDDAASYLVAASLDLMVATWLPKDGSPRYVETLSKRTSRVSNLYYTYLPTNDDSALHECLKLARSSSTIIAIVPPRHERMKRRILEAVLHDRPPHVWSLESFLSWRATSAAIDQSWPSERATVELVNAYNRRVVLARCGDSMFVDVLQHAPRTS